MSNNAAARSLHLPDELTKAHTVYFLIYTQLVASSADELKEHLPEHLAFIKGLKAKGQLVLAGPFLTREGKNSGDGMYAVEADSLEEANAIAAEDPLHQRGLRKPTVMPWAKEDN
jgi:uncharacterized protein